MPAKTTSVKSRETPRKARRKPVTVPLEQRSQMIAENAYFRAEKRGFREGDPVADWLLSEKEVDDLLSQTTR